MSATLSGKGRRRKGADAERELARLLSDELGVEVARNLAQYQKAGGHDLDGIPGWCLEVKRRAKVTEADKRAWWEQVCDASGGAGTRPVVVYRADRQEWRAVLSLEHINGGGGWGLDFAEVAEIGFGAFCQLVRESLPIDARKAG